MSVTIINVLGFVTCGLSILIAVYVLIWVIVSEIADAVLGRKERRESTK